jgi:hypothetical protein
MLDCETSLSEYLGAKATKENHLPPNAHFFEQGDDAGNLLKFNKKYLAERIAGSDSSPFDAGSSDQTVHFIEAISDKDLNEMSGKKCKKELYKRGYYSPPYNIQVPPLDPSKGGHISVSIMDDGSNPAMLVVGDDSNAASNDAFDAIMAVVKAGVKPEETVQGDEGETSRLEQIKTDFENGLPKVRHMTENEARGLLKLIGHDPRFKGGQPVVTPSYYERSCQNMYCIILFLIYWAGMFVVLGVGISTGDPYRLIRPIDYNADTCGSGSEAEPGNTFGNEQMYYPQLPTDALAIYNAHQDGETLACADSDEGCFYGMCVDGCPNKGDLVCNYEKQAAIDAECAGECSETTEACETCVADLQRAELGAGCWIVQMKQVEIFMRCLPWEPTLSDEKYECHTQKTFRNATQSVTVTEKVEIPTDNCPCNGFAEATAPSGPGGPACTPESDNPRECNAGELEQKMLLCSEGVIQRTQTSVAEYTEGTEDMSAKMTTFMAWFQQAWADVYNAQSVVLIMGPVAGAAISFVFILVMSRCAGLVVWVTLICVQVFLLVLCLFMAVQCGYLDQLVENLVTSANNNSATEWQVAAGDGAETAQAFLEQYGAFNDQDPEKSEANKTIWVVGFWVIVAFTLVYFVLMCILKKQIRLAIELIKEAGRTITKMNSLLLYPFFTYAMVFAWFAYFLVGSTYIVTTTMTMDDARDIANSYNELSDGSETGNYFEALGDLTQETLADIRGNESGIVAFNATAVDSNNFVRGLFVYHLFGYLWMAEMIKAIGMLTIAGAIASDYWITSEHFKPALPLLGSFYRAWRYHFGSAIYGGAIIAIIRLIRYIMMYIDRKTAELQQSNKAVKILMIGVQCCLWCLEKVARYISNAAYIMIAIEGRGFCASAWRSFKLLFSNSLRIATTEVIAMLVLTLSTIGISLGCTAVTITALKQMPQFTCVGLEPGEDCTNYVDNPVAPAVFVALSALFVSHCFMQVFGMAITTILLSFCLDEDKFKSGKYKDKLDDQGNKDGRMFCVINNKIGLIKMCSGSIKEEQEKLAAEQNEFAKQARP